MIVAFDVQYSETDNRASAAAVVFEEWAADKAAAEYTIIRETPGEYQPGQFYKRELQCLLDVLEQVSESVNIAIVDGYVFLDDKLGLGAHLWESLERKIAVVGVAKSPYRSCHAIEVTRGKSHRPLYVTTAGMDDNEAARRVKQMHGEFRVPALLKRADELARATFK